MKWPWAIVIAILAVCCDSPEARAPKPSPSIGKMQVAIGADVREVPFGEARCSQTGDERLVELFFVRDVSDGKLGQRPRILIARLQSGVLSEAQAFIPQAHVGDSEYDMLTLIAKDIPGASKPDCRVDEQAGELEIVCNNTTVVPWLDPGARPKPSFKVKLRCP